MDSIIFLPKSYPQKNNSSRKRVAGYAQINNLTSYFICITYIQSKTDLYITTVTVIQLASVVTKTVWQLLQVQHYILKLKSNC